MRNTCLARFVFYEHNSIIRCKDSIQWFGSYNKNEVAALQILQISIGSFAMARAQLGIDNNSNVWNFYQTWMSLQAYYIASQSQHHIPARFLTEIWCFVRIFS